MTSKKKMLICGGTGFIGRNLIEYFLRQKEYQITATHWTRPIPRELQGVGMDWVRADLRDPQAVDRIVQGQNIILQAAATTSGAKDILERPYLHVTDNAVMNSYLLRAAHDQGCEHFVFFSCTVMYNDSKSNVVEEDLDYQLTKKYFGVGWTKVYIEKMCEFFAQLGRTRFTAIRHSNIYGPHDKFDLERSHVFGATVTKVMQATDQIIVWGEGTEERDLLYVDDLSAFVDAALHKQTSSYETVNVGLGKSISIRRLVEKIIQHSQKNIRIAHDLSKPSIPFKLSMDIQKANRVFGWQPRVSLDEGVQKTLEWYKSNHTHGSNHSSGRKRDEAQVPSA